MFNISIPITCARCNQRIDVPGRFRQEGDTLFLESIKPIPMRRTLTELGNILFFARTASFRVNYHHNTFEITEAPDSDKLLAVVKETVDKMNKENSQ